MRYQGEVGMSGDCAKPPLTTRPPPPEVKMRIPPCLCNRAWADKLIGGPQKKKKETNSRLESVHWYIVLAFSRV